MKVIFINRFFYPDHSATSQMLSDLAFFLSKQGHDVTVITSRLRYDDPQDKLPSSEKISDVTIHRVWTSSFGRHFISGRVLDYFTFYVSAAWRLWWLTDKSTVIVAKTDPPLISVVARVVAVLRKARLVNWIQDLFPEVAIALNVRGFGGWLGRWLVKARNSSLKSADVNIVIGERMKEKLVEEAIEPGKIRIIDNWADGKSIEPITSDENPLRREWGLERKFVVGYSGNLGRVHEFNTILDAAVKLNNEEDIVFLFIGGGAQVDLFKEEGRRLNLNNLMFKPYQPREILNKSLGLPDVHLIVLRPETEGLIVPSKFYGIAAAGKPSLFIGDPDGEIARILKKYQVGAVIQTNDSDFLARQIRDMKQDVEKKRILGENARKVFENEYDMSKAFEKWEDVFEGLNTGVN